MTSLVDYYLFGLLFLNIGLGSGSAKYAFLDQEQENRMKDLEWTFIEPVSVDSDGFFLSHSLHYEISSAKAHRSKRNSDSSIETIRYRLMINGYPVNVQLEHNSRLYTHNLVIEERFRNASITSKVNERSSSGEVLSHCHFRGHIEGDVQSKVALSTCNGLTGMVITNNTHYFIEPMKGHDLMPGEAHPHILYKAAHISPPRAQPETQADNSYCTEKHDYERKDNSEDKPAAHHRSKRSFSREYFVETLVVVDHSMVEYYKNEDVNTYIFTIMNMVSLLFHDASIGNSVNINIVKLLLLDEEQEKMEGLVINHHADNTLDSFCKWQKSLNPSEPDDSHHDVAVLITRLDICSRMNEPCSTLGLAQVSGMCQPGRSCNVNEDTGLALAYTIAHELGHNFGMKHDGITTDCSKAMEEKSYIMFPEFLVDAGRPLIWSNCSRQAVTRFLDRGWGFCLQDEPKQVYPYPYPDKPPGVLYDVSHQCRLQYGSEADHCDGIEDMCITLWCSVKGRCISRLEPAAEGSICEWENSTDTKGAIPKKWCFDGECVPINTRPQAIDGGWGEWTDWTACSRSCGGGVSIKERHCNNPIPSNGGKYCLGERKKYKICETEACPVTSISFLQEQCTAYNDVPYKSVLYDWEPVATNNPCQLNCKPKNMYFSVMLHDMVKDGTPCLPGSRNLCITGQCRKVGCDWKLESNATEDRCGICHGDGTSCKTVKDEFSGQQSPEGQGYVEATVIPAGARNIRIEEVAEANNYLAVKSEGDEYYLNGHWYIQWTGNYNMAGTTVHYERMGNKEGITAPGPIKEPLHIMLLFQSHNPGVVFEYTVPNQNGTQNETRIPEFHWEYLDWSHCTVSCGGGHQRKNVVCMEKEAGQVDDSYCYNTSKPDDKAKPCNEHLCPATWWTGPWQHCSVSCGEGGSRHRTVLCVRSLGPEEQMALDEEDCDMIPKPITTEPCKHQPPPCPSLWRTGPWSECVDVCDVKTREVVCTASNSSLCDGEIPPVTEKACNHRIRCGQWQAGEWSKCSKSCGEGLKHRTVDCIDGASCKSSDRPDDLLPCNQFPCSSYIGSVNNRRHNSYNRYEKNGGRNDFAPVYPAPPDKQERRPKNDSNTERPGVWSKLWNYVTGNRKQTGDNRIIKPTPNPAYNESWHVADWSQCGVTCGTGERTRRVWCPLKGSCNPEEKPAHMAVCTEQPCLTWVAGSWSQCTVTCGGGSQERNVQCINLESDNAALGCDTQTKPQSQQDCNSDKCNTVSAALRASMSGECEKDTLAADTCQQLKDRGFCAFKYVSRNCCKLCQS